MYWHVRSTASGLWRTVDLMINGVKVDEKCLVMAREKARWCVNNLPVDVIPGLVVSFRDCSAAEYFVNNGRGAIVAVEPEHVVAFLDESDARFFVNRGMGQLMGDREVQALYEAMGAEGDGEEGEGDGDEGDEPETGKGRRRSRKRVKA